MSFARSFLSRRSGHSGLWSDIFTTLTALQRKQIFTAYSVAILIGSAPEAAGRGAAEESRLRRERRRLIRVGRRGPVLARGLEILADLLELVLELVLVLLEL